MWPLKATQKIRKCKNFVVVVLCRRLLYMSHFLVSGFGGRWRWKLIYTIRYCIHLQYKQKINKKINKYISGVYNKCFCCRFTLVDMPDMDVFGSTNTKKAIDCTCPNCERPVASSRFAPHLEKCMGKHQSIRFWLNCIYFIRT